MLRNLPLRWYWLGRTASLIATSIILVAAPITVYQLTESPLWVSAIVVAHGAPYLVVGPVAGAVADRVSRLRILRAAETSSAIAMASVPITAVVGNLTAPHVITAVAITRVAFCFADAANFGLVPALAPPGQLAAVMAVVFATASVVEMVGPAISGLLLTFWSAAGVLSIAAVAAAIAALAFSAQCLPTARAPASARHGIRTEIVLGIRWLVGARRARLSVLLGTTAAFGFGVFVSQVVPWAAQRLAVPADDGRVGALFAAWALGGLLATAIVPVIVRRIGEWRVSEVATWVSACGALGCATASHLSLAMMAVSLWGSGYLATVLATVVWRQTNTPDQLRSRVNTVARMIALGVGYPCGGLSGGLMSAAVAPHVSLAVAGLVMASVAVAGGRFRRGDGS